MKHYLVQCLFGAILFVGAVVLDAERRYPELTDPFGPSPDPASPVDRPRTDGGSNPEASGQLGAPGFLKPPDDGDAGLRHLEALENFLNMPPDQLAQVRSTIERIEAMSEEEKARLRARIKEFRELHADQIQKLRQAHHTWQTLSGDDRRLIHRYMMSLPREETKEVRGRLLSLGVRERQQYLMSLLQSARLAQQSGDLPDIEGAEGLEPSRTQADRRDLPPRR